MAIVHLDLKRVLTEASEPDNKEMAELVLKAEKKIEAKIVENPYEYSWCVIGDVEACEAEVLTKIGYINSNFSSQLQAYKVQVRGSVYTIGFRVFREELLKSGE